MDAEHFEKSNQGTGQIPPIIAFAAGLLLVLPLMWVLFTTRWQPLQATLNFSTQDYNILSPSEFVGSANFERLAQDSQYTSAVGFTTAFVLARTLIILLVPPLVGIMAGMGGFMLRSLNRMVLSIIAVFIAPVGMALLWQVYVGQLWGREPSPIFSPKMPFSLGDPNTAQTSLLALDGLITLALALAVGATAFMAVVRGRESQHTGRAGIGLWLTCGLLALMSAAETLVLPFILTRGGPFNSTLTLPLSIYNSGFQRLAFGYAAAQIVPLIIAMIPIVVLLWLVIVGLRLRLTFTPAPSSEAGGCMSFLGLLLMVVLAVPIIGLVIWGFTVANSVDGFAALPEALDWNSALLNTVVVPLQTIWLVQIPVMWLAGMALGFFRPLGRLVSNLLFLPLLFLAFLPTELLMLAWYEGAREANIVNTLQALSLPWMVSGFALIVFRMFFDGAYDKYQAAVQSGKSGMEAFISSVILPSLPVALVVGAALSFASTQSFTWHLIIINDPELWGIPVGLMQLMNQYITDTGMITAAAVQFIGIFALIFIPVFFLLHVFVLDRLAIVAGAAGKAKNDALFGDIDHEPKRVEWS